MLQEDGEAVNTTPRDSYCVPRACPSRLGSSNPITVSGAEPWARGPPANVSMAAPSRATIAISKHRTEPAPRKYVFTGAMFPPVPAVSQQGRPYT